jgi:hypothetical protein
MTSYGSARDIFIVVLLNPYRYHSGQQVGFLLPHGESCALSYSRLVNNLSIIKNH